MSIYFAKSTVLGTTDRFINKQTKSLLLSWYPSERRRETDKK